MNGLDLFSGIGGLTLALAPWVRPRAYCDIDRYSRAVLLSRMQDGLLPLAPIWDDVRTLCGHSLPPIDIIYGGFPCQDISVAGRGKGLDGERSGLFFEIVRLAKEIRPQFLFLENVPAIRTRGLDTVGWELAQAGYDSRWCVISASEVGANHKRERWFLLANASSQPIRQEVKRREKYQCKGRNIRPYLATGDQSMADSIGSGWERGYEPSQCETESARISLYGSNARGWWEIEPCVGRVVDGLPFRMDRIKGLGNAVVPRQARTAFQILSGIES